MSLLCHVKIFLSSNDRDDMQENTSDLTSGEVSDELSDSSDGEFKLRNWVSTSG